VREKKIPDPDHIPILLPTGINLQNPLLKNEVPPTHEIGIAQPVHVIETVDELQTLSKR